MHDPGPYRAEAPSRAEVDAWDGPALLVFGADGCGHCRAAHQSRQQLTRPAPLAARPSVPHQLDLGQRRRFGRAAPGRVLLLQPADQRGDAQQGIGILDYKTRKTKPGEKVEAYDNQAMQLAAYGATYWGEENLPRLLAANVFISTTEPGRIEVVKHPDVLRDWQAFKLVASLWRYQKGYDPLQHQTLNQPAA